MPSVTAGTYTIYIELRRSASIEIGALGQHQLPAGTYAYTGSAFGPGGLGRVDRHYELATGERDTRHWHIDYLLGHGAASIRGDVRSIGVDIECAVASALPEASVSGFGASDCACSSHLAYDDDGSALHEVVASAHRHARGDQ